MTDEEKNAYRYMIKLLIEIGSQTRIDNDGPDHARIILEEMFRAAKRTAYVFCGCVSAAVWGGEDMAKIVTEAIDRGVDVKFIVQRPDDLELRAQAVYDVVGNAGRILHSEAFANLKPHFSVFDEKMYRIEKSDANKTARACANDTDTSKRLHDYALRMIEFAGQEKSRAEDPKDCAEA